jgi:hypothetical protein
VCILQVRPPLSNLPVPAVLCANVRCPRLAVALHLEGSGPATLQAGLSGVSATLDATSRITMTVHSASCAITPSEQQQSSSQQGGGDAAGAGGATGAATLLQAPCVSFVLLHQMDVGEATASEAHDNERADRDAAKGRTPPFLALGYRPPGVQETELETQLMAHDTGLGPRGGFGAANGHDAGVQRSESMQSTRSAGSSGGVDEAPDNLLSSLQNRSAVLRGESANPRKWGTGSNVDPDAVRVAVGSLSRRLGLLQGSQMLGSVRGEVAPVEAYVDAPALLRVLEFGVALRARLFAGDKAFSECASCKHFSACARVSTASTHRFALPPVCMHISSCHRIAI